MLDAYRERMPVEELAAPFQINKATILGHVWRREVPKRDCRALRGDDVDGAAKPYAGRRSAQWVARELEVAAGRRDCPSAGT